MKAYYDQKDLALIQKDKEIIGVNEELKNLKLYYREVQDQINTKNEVQTVELSNKIKKLAEENAFLIRTSENSVRVTQDYKELEGELSKLKRENQNLKQSIMDVSFCFIKNR